MIITVFCLWMTHKKHPTLKYLFHHENHFEHCECNRSQPDKDTKKGRKAYFIIDLPLEVTYLVGHEFPIVKVYFLPNTFDKTLELCRIIPPKSCRLTPNYGGNREIKWSQEGNKVIAKCYCSFVTWECKGSRMVGRWKMALQTARESLTGRGWVG